MDAAAGCVWTCPDVLLPAQFPHRARAGDRALRCPRPESRPSAIANRPGIALAGVVRLPSVGHLCHVDAGDAPAVPVVLVVCGREKEEPERPLELPVNLLAAHSSNTASPNNGRPASAVRKPHTAIA